MIATAVVMLVLVFAWWPNNVSKWEKRYQAEKAKYVDDMIRERGWTAGAAYEVWNIANEERNRKGVMLAKVLDHRYGLRLVVVFIVGIPLLALFIYGCCYLEQKHYKPNP